MDDDFELREFSHVTRLFPLPNIVLVPHVVLPLQIFAPRYRQMTEDALATDALVTIANLRSSPNSTSLGSPPLERVACLGRIVRHERLEDGRFNFLLHGWKRVNLLHEVATDKLYRMAKVEILEDVFADDASTDSLRDELVETFRVVFEKHSQLDSDLVNLLDKPVPLNVLTDMVAQALGLPSEMKQALLNEPRVVHRCETLLAVLRQIISNDPSLARGFRRYPPPFSVN